MNGEGGSNGESNSSRVDDGDNDRKNKNDDVGVSPSIIPILPKKSVD